MKRHQFRIFVDQRGMTYLCHGCNDCIYYRETIRGFSFARLQQCPLIRVDPRDWPGFHKGEQPCGFVFPFFLQRYIIQFHQPDCAGFNLTCTCTGGVKKPLYLISSLFLIREGYDGRSIKRIDIRHAAVPISFLSSIADSVPWCGLWLHGSGPEELAPPGSSLHHRSIPIA